MSPDASFFGGSGDAYTIAIYLITISFMLAGICIGLGKAFNIRRLEAFGKEEFIQAVVGAAMVGGLAALVIGMSTAFEAAPLAVTGSANMTGANITGPCQAIVSNILNVTYDNDTNMSNPLIKSLVDNQKCYSSALGQEIDRKRTMAMLYSTLATLNIGGEAGWNLGPVTTITASIQPLAALGVLAEEAKEEYVGMQSQVAMADEQAWILTFVDSAAFKIFLPLGLLFRLFFPTRKFGGALMAVAVVAYVIYPVMPVASNASFTQSIVTGGQTPPPLSDSCANATQSMSLSGISFDVVGMANAYKNFDPVCYYTAYTSRLQLVETLTSTAQFTLFDLPIFCFILSLVAIWPLAEVFGGEYTFGISEMI